MTKLAKGRVVNGTFVNANGTVRSLNPSVPPPWADGGSYGPYTWSEQAPHTAGQYEKFSVSGGKAVYDPTGHEPVLFVFVDAGPDGLAAISVEPL